MLRVLIDYIFIIYEDNSNRANNTIVPYDFCERNITKQNQPALKTEKVDKLTPNTIKLKIRLAMV